MLVFPSISYSNLKLYHRMYLKAIKMKFLTEINRGN